MVRRLPPAPARSLRARSSAGATILRAGALVALALTAFVTAGCKDKAKEEKAAALAKATCPTCVVADERGFTPSQLEVPGGGPREITFTRLSDETCATEVVFPELGIKEALPLNRPVAIKLPPGEGKTYGFQCGMGMYKSAVVVR
jgi:plastocyanin domain-containing protein